jgi:hypothetical protein
MQSRYRRDAALAIIERVRDSDFAIDLPARIGARPLYWHHDGDGYLQPILDANHDDGEVGYLELRDALRDLDDGASYRQVAKTLPIARTALSRIHQDDERRAWYLDGEATDGRVAAALEVSDAE